MNLRPAVLSLALAFATGCIDRDPTGNTDRVSLAISDAANGGLQGFYFLPPLVRVPSWQGTFDPGLSPVVEICSDPGCETIHARFTMDAGEGPARLRVDLTDQHYIVNWSMRTTGATPGHVYRLRVLLNGLALGFVDVALRPGRGAIVRTADGEVTTIPGSTVPVKFRIEETTGRTLEAPVPPARPSCRSCLELVPGTLLLPGLGAQRQLAAFLVDAGGVRTPVAAAFESSSPSAVSVSATGIATATAAVGSSQITAHAGTLSSAPALVLVAQPAAGALLVSDGQVDGDVVPVDPAAPYGLGWLYRVRLRQPFPTVGQIVLGTGAAPVGGKVTGVTPVSSDEADVIVAVATLPEMFTAIAVAQHIPLGPGSLVPAVNAAPQSFGSGIAALKSEFSVGVFKCEAETAVGVSFPVLADAFSGDVYHDLAVEVELGTTGLRRLVVTGSIQPTLSVNPVISSKISGEVECKWQIGAVTLPVGGPLGYLIGTRVVLGLGFGLGAETDLGNLGFDAYLQTTLTVSLGVACVEQCGLVADMTETHGGYFKPIVPNLAGDDKFELEASLFGYAALALGPPFTNLKFETLEVKAGLKQSAKLAGTKSQVDDPAYASSFELAPFLEAGASADLDALGDLLSIELADLSYEPDLTPLAKSPSGTFTIQPSQVFAGVGTIPGQLATFTVTLDPVTYLQADAVDSVEIRREVPDGQGGFTLQANRPGCTAIAATPGQTLFTCQAEFPDADAGLQTFHAFVHFKMFGVSVPVPLEVAVDARASLQVKRTTVAVSPSSVTLGVGGTTAFIALINGIPSGGPVTWSTSGGTIDENGFYQAPGALGDYTVTATHAQDNTKSASATVHVASGGLPPSPPPSVDLKILGLFSGGVPIANPIQFRLRVVGVNMDEARFIYSATSTTIGLGDLTSALTGVTTGPVQVDSFTRDWFFGLGYPALWKGGRGGFRVTLHVIACIYKEGIPVPNAFGQPLCLYQDVDL